MRKLDKDVNLGNDVVEAQAKKIGHDISEIYSPFRIVERAKKHGWRHGFSFDFTRQFPDWEFWGFSKKHTRQRAILELSNNQFEMLIYSSNMRPFQSAKES